MLSPERKFPVVVVAFVSERDDLQREQFVLVNKTKPLPRDLINELLPRVAISSTPRGWQHRRLASEIVDVLRWTTASPFCGRVRGVGSSGEGCNISFAAVLAAVEGSVRRGLLREQIEAQERADPEDLANTVAVFFDGVRRTWPYAWSGSPRTSRLVNGVGIAGMAALLEVVMKGIDPRGKRPARTVARRLSPLIDVCRWTEGRWRGLELQNTSQDKRRLAAHLLEVYARRV